eukprot:959697-Pleurochrysis_carterae.AAC.1
MTTYFLTLARRTILAIVVARRISMLAGIICQFATNLHLHRMRTCGALALRSPGSGTLACAWPPPPAQHT